MWRQALLFESYKESQPPIEYDVLVLDLLIIIIIIVLIIVIIIVTIIIYCPLKLAWPENQAQIQLDRAKTSFDNRGGIPRRRPPTDMIEYLAIQQL